VRETEIVPELVLHFYAYVLSGELLFSKSIASQSMTMISCTTIAIVFLDQNRKIPVVSSA